MNRNVDIAGQQGIFDFAGEQTLSADFLQWTINNAVARRLDHDNGKGFEGQIEGVSQPVAGFMRLRQCKRRASGADVERFARGGQFYVHGLFLAAARCPANTCIPPPLRYMMPSTATPERSS